MSHVLKINKPNNLPIQLYYVKYEYEYKYICGKKCKKIEELRKIEGITNIIERENYTNKYHKILEINGEPNSVDDLKNKISKLLSVHNFHIKLCNFI